jgi:hypothetical protein
LGERNGGPVMADCTLSDGREVTFDLNRMTVREWRGFLDNVTPEIEDSLIERCAGFGPGEIGELGVDDWKALSSAFYKRISDPRADAKN